MRTDEPMPPDEPMPTDQEWLARQFDDQRPHLQAVAYRMLGSATEADDAVQETWLRLSRTDAGEVENLGAWLTTVVGRVSLDMLRSRKSHPEQPLGPHLQRSDSPTCFATWALCSAAAWPKMTPHNAKPRP